MPRRCFLVKLSPSSETLRVVKNDSKNIWDNILSQFEVLAFLLFHPVNVSAASGYLQVAWETLQRPR